MIVSCEKKVVEENQNLDEYFDSKSLVNDDRQEKDLLSVL